MPASMKEHYINTLTEVLKSHFSEIRDKYESREQFMEDSGIEHPEGAIVEIPKTLLCSKGDLNRPTAYEHGDFWKLQEMFKGVENMYRQGRLKINVITFIEEELGGWNPDEPDPESDEDTGGNE